LQCRHPVGPIINGEPEFGWRDFSGFAEFGMVLPSKVMLDAADEIATLRAQLAASEARAEWLAWTLRGMRCPRPCNTDPDDTTVAQCIALGHCGCGAALAELDAK